MVATSANAVRTAIEALDRSRRFCEARIAHVQHSCAHIGSANALRRIREVSRSSIGLPEIPHRADHRAEQLIPPLTEYDLNCTQRSRRMLPGLLRGNGELPINVPAPCQEK